jgi:hypothetical protein
MKEESAIKKFVKALSQPIKKNSNSPRISTFYISRYEKDGDFYPAFLPTSLALAEEKFHHIKQVVDEEKNSFFYFMVKLHVNGKPQWAIVRVAISKTNYIIKHRITVYTTKTKAVSDFKQLD